MERAGEFLGKTLRRLDRPEVAVAWLASAWPTVVGKTLAAHTRPVRCGGGCLELAADNKAWRKQLETMKRELCGRINQAWGGKLVSDVKFVSGRPGLKRIAREADNDHIPFIRRKRA